MSNTLTSHVDPAEAQRSAEKLRTTFKALRAEIHRVFVGQTDLVDLVLSAFIADGHVLIEGVPGLGKTLLVRTLASAVSLTFSRIQFTPDLMPADITGTTVLTEKPGGGHELHFEAGPIHANVVLADEINRATPKTQSALLEAMQERHVTVGRRTMALPDPFVVLATQNPVEQEGTYPLPEAQLDRFMAKVVVGYPSESDYLSIMDRTTTTEHAVINPVCTGEQILTMRSIVRSVPVSTQVGTYAVRLIIGTQPGSAYAPELVNKYVALGASPRGVQAVLLLSKVRALLEGRFAVSCQDIRAVAVPALRHRLVLNFAGQAERVSSDEIIKAVVTNTRELSE